MNICKERVIRSVLKWCCNVVLVVLCDAVCGSGVVMMYCVVRCGALVM